MIARTRWIFRRTDVVTGLSKRADYRSKSRGLQAMISSLSIRRGEGGRHAGGYSGRKRRRAF